MIRKFASVVGILAAVAVAGCGGSGANEDGSANSVYTGQYQGTFTTSTSESGTLSIQILDSGDLAGTGHNDTLNADETVTGSVTNTGLMKVTFKYPASSASATGNVALENGTEIQGTVTESNGESVSLNLQKQ